MSNSDILPWVNYDALNRDPEESAADLGCYVVYPKGSELQVDIDSEEAYQKFLLNYNRFCNEGAISVVSCTETPSKSGLPNRHITIKLGYTICKWERIALQFALGSDPIRETLCVLRYSLGIENPIRFFEPIKESKDAV